MTIDFARSAGRGLRLARSAFFGSSLVLAGLAPALSAAEEEASVDLASAASYAVLADNAVTNTGNTVVNGDLGVHPGREVSGFPPGVINGQRHVGDDAAQRAQSDLTAAYQDAAGRDSRRVIGPELQGLTLAPGVYKVSENANLDGTLTLDAQGNPEAVFIFQVGSDLSTGENSNVRVVNSPRPACSVFWTVGDSATLGSNTSFTGRVMAVDGIRLRSSAKIEQGGALSRDGTVTLDTNAVSRANCAPAAAPAPPPTAPPSPTRPTPSPTVSPTTPTPSPTSPSPTSPSPTSPSPTSPSPTSPSPTSPSPTSPSPTSPSPTSPSPTSPSPTATETSPAEAGLPPGLSGELPPGLSGELPPGLSEW